MIFKKTSFFKYLYFQIICWALVVTMIYIMLGKTGEMFNNEDNSIFGKAKNVAFMLEHCNCERL